MSAFFFAPQAEEAAMLKVMSVVAAAGAVIALPLMGSTAWSAACTPGPISGYESSSCSVGPVTFGPIAFANPVGNVGNVTVTPITIGNENSLEFNYSAGNGTASDVVFTYTVSAAPGSLLTDAFAQFTGVAPATLGETFDANGNPSAAGMLVGEIMLAAPGSQVIGISPPQTSLLQVKDQATQATGEASALINGFSTSSVPGAIVGAGLPGLVAALGALVAMARRRRKQLAA
jgi:hypothetical protein